MCIMVHSGIKEDALAPDLLQAVPSFNVDQSRNITLDKGHYQSNTINFTKNINIERQAQCDGFLILRAQLCHSCSPIFKASFFSLLHFKS